MLKVLILRAPGTNCDIETKRCIDFFNMHGEIIHINKLIKGEESLEKYHALIIPGGFSYGDRVRSGAILGKILKEKLGKDLRKFLDEGKPILGICNGFQTLIEAGLFENISLLKNVSNRYECRWVYLKVISDKTIFTKGMKNEILYLPVAHAEGRVFLNDKTYKNYEESSRIVLKYCKENGEEASLEYPYNPNGSYYDIAGVCDESGLVFGLMPHPERAFYGYLYPDWTRNYREYGHGYKIFKNLYEYLRRKF